ncbi:hypothetical protein TOC8171_51240 [Pseudomonas syringae]
MPKQIPFQRLLAAGLFATIVCISATAKADQAKEILFAAIKQGQASAELTGEQADAWKKKNRFKRTDSRGGKSVEPLQAARMRSVGGDDDTGKGP